MLNSPTICQNYVHRALQPIREKWSSAYIIHYMDDILIALPRHLSLTNILNETETELKQWGLQIAPDKIQIQYPMNYLGNKIQANSIIPQKIQIRRDHLKTLNDFQKLLGDINWIRPLLGIPTYKLHLFNILKRPSDLNSPRDLTSKAEEELKWIEQHIQKAQLSKIDLHKPLLLLIYFTPHSPKGLLCQCDGWLE